MLTNIYNFLAELPWYVPAGLMLLGAVLAYAGSARLERPILRTGLAALLVGLLLLLTSWLLVSDRERVVILSRQLVHAVAARDWPRVEGFMHPKANAFTVIKGREAVCNATRLGAERIDLRSASVAGASARTDHHEGFIVSLAVYSTATSAEANTLTNWELDWAFLDGRWQLVEIRGMDGPWVRASNLADWIQRGR